MRRVKLAVYGVLTIVVVAIIVGAVFSLFYDLNGLKPTLAEAAREETGRNLVIDGDITVSLFPRPRATATGIRLSNVEGGSEPDAVTIDVASVQVSWLPLIRGSLDVRQIHARGVRVLVEQGLGGKSSLALEPQSSAEGSAEPFSYPDIIDIRDIAVVTRDGAGDAVYEVERLTLQPNGIGGPTNIGFDARLNGETVTGQGVLGDLDSLGGPADFPVSLAIEAGGATVRIKGALQALDREPALALRVGVTGGSLASMSRLAGADLPATDAYELTATVAGTLERIGVDDVAFRSNGVALAGSARIDLAGARPMISVDLAASDMNLTSFLAADGPVGEGRAAGPEGAMLGDGPLPFGFTRQLDADLRFSAASIEALGLSLSDAALDVRSRAGLIEISRLAARLPSGALEASGQVDARLDEASLSFEANVTGLDVAGVLDALNLPARSERRASATVSVVTRGATRREIADNLTATVQLSELEIALEDSASLVLNDANVRFDGRDRPVAVAARGTVRGETVRIAGRFDPLSAYRHGEPYAFQATAESADARMRLEADMRAAMVEGLAVRVAVEGQRLSGMSRLTGLDLPEVGPYRLSGLLAFDEGAVSLREAEIDIAGSDLRGDVVLTFGTGLPGLTADLRSGRIDLASLSPTADTALAERIAAEGGAEGVPVTGDDASPLLNDRPLDLGPLFGITADLKLAVASLENGGMTLNDVAVRVVSDGKELRLDNLSTAANGRQARLSGTLRWTGQEAEISAEAQVNGIDVDPFLAESGLGRRVDMGPLDVSMSLSSNGNSRRSLFDNATFEVVANDFRLDLRTDDVVPHDPLALDTLTLAVEGPESPVTLTAQGTFGSEALEIKARLEPLARLRLMEPVPLDVSIATPTSHVRISGTAPDRRQPAELDFNVSAEGRIIREIAAVAGLALNPDGPWRIASMVRVGDDRIELREATARVGTSDVAGSFSAETGGGNARIEVVARSSRLAIADFLPPPDEPDVAPAAEPGPLFDPAPFDLAPLRGLDLTVALDVASFAGRSVEGTGLKLNARASEGIVTLDTLSATVGEGPVSATGRLDVRGDRAEAEFAMAGGPFDLGALLLEFGSSAGSQNVVNLPVDMDVRITSVGASAHDLAAAAEGQISLIGGKGYIQQRSFRFLDQGLLRELAPWAGEQRDRTEVNCFVSRFDVAKGVATSRALLLDAEYLSVSGRGSVDLGAETLNMTLTPRPKEVRLLDLAVPIAVTGPIGDPKFAPTTAGTAKKVATTLGILVNPLVLLVPVIEGVTAEKNPCLAAIEQAESNQPAENQDGAVGGVIRGIGEGIEGVGRGIGRILGGNKE
jgi:uncharacterized protein involved in outer membrane biogenesis